MNPQCPQPGGSPSLFHGFRRRPHDPYSADYRPCPAVWVLLFGGGGGYYAHRSYGGYGSGGVLGLLVIILLLIWLVGGFTTA